MNVQEFIYKASKEKNEHQLTECDTQCICCSREINEGVPSKKIIGAKFTNRDLFQKGEFLCEACANLLKGELSAKLRKSNFIAYKDHIEYFKQDVALKKLLTIKETPFSVGLTFSYKKHNAFRSYLCYDTENYIIRQEDNFIEFKRKDVENMFKSIKPLYCSFFTKEEIKTGAYKIHNIEKIGIIKFQQHEDVLKKYRNTLLFNLTLELFPYDIKKNSSKKIKEIEKRRKNETK